MSEPATAESPDIPEFDDDYLRQVAGRLVYNYDLERDRTVADRTVDLYGHLTIERKKHFMHPALSIAHHTSDEHLFVIRERTVRVVDLEALVDLGHDLAGDWIEPSERHYSTDFTFVVVCEPIPEAVRSFVDGFADRTLLKFGYHGHYEVNLAVVAPEREAIVASDGADVAEAFRVWSTLEADEPSWFDLIKRRFQL